MKTPASIFLLLIFFSCYSTAQILDDHCGTDAFLQHRIDGQPQLAAALAAEERATQIRLANKHFNAEQRSAEIYTIPVVVHIVWHSEADNISDAQVYSQLAVLNEDFRQKNLNQSSLPAEFSSLAADIGFEFCLAEFDPEGNPSTGITRTQTIYNGIGNYEAKSEGESRIFQTALGGKDAWDPERYLNIWVADTRGTYLGFGVLPTNNAFKSYEDGIIVDPKYFGTNYNTPYHLGRVATHEIGHYFNLSHIWGANCQTDDGVADTPLQAKPYRGCPEYPAFSCGSSDMFMNFMDYGDDACISMFSKGQKERMLDALFTYRPGLIQTEICQIKADSSKAELLVFPNPATDGWLRINLSSAGSGVAEIRLISAVGIVLHQSRHLPDNIPPIFIGNLPTAIYFLDVVIGNEHFTAKVFIQNVP